MVRSSLLLLLLISSVASLTLNNFPQHDLQQDHELLAITSPCSSGYVAYDLGKASVANGCGTSGILGQMARALGPYNSVMTPCCNGHDHCFQKCGVPNFLKTYNSCNTVFKKCMYSECDAYAKKQKWWKRTAVKTVCKANALTYYGLVSTGGRYFYNQEQKKFCGCKKA
jgi:hypothetical protein